MPNNMLSRRAMDCRNLAKGAQSQADREMLEDIAADLDGEARRLSDLALQDNCAERLFAYAAERRLEIVKS